MSRNIPSLKVIRAQLSDCASKAHDKRAKPGKLDSAEYIVRQVRKALVQWRDRQIGITEALDTCNTLLDAHGVEYIDPEGPLCSDERGSLRYVNMGDTYAATLVYDQDRSRVWACSWGDRVEADERAGKRYG